MHLSNTLRSADISATGLAAERHRMEITTANIANAHVTRTADGGPYRRQEVIFASQEVDGRDSPTRVAGGVQVLGIAADQTELPRIYQPGHPDADTDGYVTYPNVQLPREMVDLLTASRAYEANLKSLQTFQRMAEQALNLLRGGR
ncbi:MAG: flagellar basal body rod protein FlgC [Planctomycetaceae bacterium]